MINAYLHIDGKKLRILHFDFYFDQSLGTNNKPSNKPQGGQINVSLESTKDISLLEWVESDSIMKDGRIEVFSNDGAQITFKIEFANAYGTSSTYSFSAFSSEPMSYTITITPGIMRYNRDNQTMHEQPWNLNNPFTDTTPVTRREENEPNFIRVYTTDMDELEISDFNTGDKIILVIETENTIGKTITLALNDKTHDFKHNGVILENDTLKNYKIGNDIEKVELEVIDQQN